MSLLPVLPPLADKLLNMLRFLLDALMAVGVPESVLADELTEAGKRRANAIADLLEQQKFGKDEP
jgi:hypothetical protein